MLGAVRGLVLGFVVAGCGSSPTPTAQPPEPTPVSTTGTISTGRFHSPSLGVEKDYVVYLPGGYADSERRYPVIYLLHGASGNETRWSEALGLVEAADGLGLEALVVMPDGDDSIYVNWATPVDYEACLRGEGAFGQQIDMARYCVRHPRYEDYIAEDLVAHIDSTYRTIPTRAARAIGGASMGGAGALSVGLRNRGTYISIASHCGSAALLKPEWAARETAIAADDRPMWIDVSSAGEVIETRFHEHAARVFGSDIANWRAHDPAHLVKNLDDGEISIYLDCGTEDDLGLDEGLRQLHQILEARGISHAYHLVPGRHGAAFWRDRIDDSLRFHIAAFAGRSR